jgi:regulator of RNase E activity RraB
LVGTWSKGNSRDKMLALFVSVGSGYGGWNGYYSDKNEKTPP